jgi:NAD(P)-dependent dehydrogenase (short-subunit alcohol dehydrogenase family)
MIEFMMKKILLLGTLLVLSLNSIADTVLITGTNRGIGLEFGRQYAEKGYTVIATARTPEKAEELIALAKGNNKIIIEKLDVTDHTAIDALAEKYKEQSIDILLNNAGISGGSDSQKFGNIDYAVFDTAMRVNVQGPLKMAEAFLPHVLASEQKKIIAVSSSMGSIKKTFGILYTYRASKAALNMTYATMAKELKRKKVIVGLVNPGPTSTDFMKGVKGKLREPSVAVTDMMRNIDGLTIKTTGSFLQYNGKKLPW